MGSTFVSVIQISKYRNISVDINVKHNFCKMRNKSVAFENVGLGSEK